MGCNCNKDKIQHKQICAPTIECLKVHSVICTKSVQKVAELTIPFNQLMNGIIPPPISPKPETIPDPEPPLEIICEDDNELDPEPQLEAICEENDKLDSELKLEVISEKEDELDSEIQLETIVEDDELDPELEVITEQKAKLDPTLKSDYKHPSELKAALDINAAAAVGSTVQYNIVPNPAGIVMRGTLINGKVVNSGYVPITVTLTGTATLVPAIKLNLPFQEETECPGACVGDDLQETQPIIEAIIPPVFTPSGTLGALGIGTVTFKVIIKTQITISREKLVYASVNVIEDINPNRCDHNYSTQATTKQFFGQ